MFKFQKGEEPVKQTEDELQPMRAGDYMIHIFLQCGKSFKLDFSNETFNAMVKVKCDSHEQFSTVKKECALKTETNQVWNEHLFIEMKKRGADQIQLDTIEITVQDKGLFRDKIVGTFEIDIAKVYGMNDKHAIEHQWVALCNTHSENPEEIKGFIKLGIAVQGPGDNTVRLSEDPEGDHNEHDVMMPASIQRNFKQLRISIIKAQDLPKMDIISSKACDLNAYIKSSWKGTEFKTKIFDRKISAKDKTCIFYETFKLGITWPQSYHKMRFQVFDHDLITEDEIIGTIVLDLKFVVDKFSNETGGFYWMEVYGAPTTKVTSEGINQMNKDPETASRWHGRVLFHFHVYDSKYPEIGVEPMNDKVKDQLRLFESSVQPTNKYNVMAEFLQAICLPKDKKKMKVRIQIGNTKVESKLIDNTSKGYYAWKKSTVITAQYLNNFQYLNRMEAIFVYLIDSDGQEVSFWRGSALDFMEEQPCQKWIALRPNYPVKNCTATELSGIIQLKLRITNVDQALVEWKDISMMRTEENLQVKPHIVRCFIYQCRNLAAIDADGTSDPYIKVFNPQGQNLQTITIKDTCNPLFYSIIDFKYEFDELENSPPVVFNCYDSDKSLFDSSDDYMGSAVINLNKAKTHICIMSPGKSMLEPPEPKWHSITNGLYNGAPECGSVLCSFVVVKAESIDYKNLRQMELQKMVKQKDFNININVLGLRNLKSFGLLPVQKAFIRFLIKNMLPPNKSQVVQNLQTEPNKPGPNPNINTTIQFICRLPEDKIFCPVLCCEVYDQMFKGLKQPKLGTFNISIGELMYHQDSKRKKLLKLGQFSIQFLLSAVTKIKPKKQKQTRDKMKSDEVHYRDHFNWNKHGTLIEDTSMKNFNQMRIRNSTKEKRLIFNIEGAHLGSSLVDQRTVMQRVDRQSSLQTNYLPQAIGSGEAHEHEMNEEDELLQEVMDDETFIEHGDPYMMFEQSDFTPDDQEESEEEGLQMPINISAVERDTIKTNDDASVLSFTSTTRYIRHNLEVYIQSSQYETMTEEERDEERFELIEAFKRGMFAQSDRQRAIGQKHFIQLTDKIKSRRESQYLLTQEEKQKNVNEEMKALEARFVQHFLENKMNMINVDKRMMSLKQEREELMMCSESEDLMKNVIMPCYHLDTRISALREHNPPPSTMFQALGHDIIALDGKEIMKRQRHYRRFFEDELENNTQIFTQNPFLDISVNKVKLNDRSIGSFLGSLLGKSKQADDLSSAETVQVGQFRGKVEVYDAASKIEQERGATELFQQVDTAIRDCYMKFHGEQMDFDLTKVASRNERIKLRNILLQMGIHEKNILQFLHEYSYTQMLKSEFSAVKNCFVRLYLIEGFDLASRDIGSFSDPYYVVSLGRKKEENRENYQLDEPNPQFHVCLNFSAQFPGADPLVIEMWDYDDLFGDDLIGITIIELNDRWFCPDWKAIEHKPIEHRELYHPSTSLPQGVITCWVDIFEDGQQEFEVNKQWDITPEESKEYQIRLSVFDTKNVPMMDIEGVSDVFIKAWIEDDKKEETDTHWRCKTGQASFNWRMLFNYKFPSKTGNRVLKLQIYDRDVLSGNDFICEFSLDIGLIMEDARLTQRVMHFTKTYYNDYFKDNYPANTKSQKLEVEWEDEETFWLSAYRDGDSKPIQLRLDLRILPMSSAQQSKVGQGQENPNHSPYLPKPYGRMEFSLNPFEMMAQLIGKDLIRKIKGFLCCFACLFLLISMLPIIISEVVSDSIVNLFTEE